MRNRRDHGITPICLGMAWTLSIIVFWGAASGLSAAQRDRTCNARFSCNSNTGVCNFKIFAGSDIRKLKIRSGRSTTIYGLARGDTFCASNFGVPNNFCNVRPVKMNCGSAGRTAQDQRRGGTGGQTCTAQLTCHNDTRTSTCFVKVFNGADTIPLFIPRGQTKRFRVNPVATTYCSNDYHWPDYSCNQRRLQIHCH